MKITSEPTAHTLEWGISPPKPTALAYGARAIYKRPFVDGKCLVDIDLLWDRQHMSGGTERERKAFATFLNKKAFALIRRLCWKHSVFPDDSETRTAELGDFEIVFSPRSSYGYLYIGVWPKVIT